MTEGGQPSELKIHTKDKDFVHYSHRVRHDELELETVYTNSTEKMVTYIITRSIYSGMTANSPYSC